MKLSIQRTNRWPGRLSFNITILLISLLSLVQPAWAAPGDLDITFNPGGTGAESPGTVYAVELLSNGQIMIGGQFTSYNGNTNAPDGIMRLNADGTPDTNFNFGASSGINGYVYSVVTHDVNGNPLPGNKILVGGNFTSYNGDTTASDYILRLNADGSLDTTFNAGGTGADDEVVSIAVQSDGKILVGGFFSAYNGDPNAPNRILRLSSNGYLDTSFNYGQTGVNLGSVQAIAIQADGNILIGGPFTRYNSNLQAPDGLLRLDSNGLLDPSFNTGTGIRGLRIGSFAGYANSIVIESGGTILVGGYFDSYGTGAAAADSNASDYILRLTANGALDTTTFNYGAGLGANSVVFDLAVLSDGMILIGGHATSYNGDTNAPDRLFRLAANGALDTTFNYGGVGLDDAPNAIALDTTENILLGGLFTSYNGNINAPDAILRLSNGLPTVTINQAVSQVDPTSASPINFTVVFSSPVTGFGDSANDVTLSGTASGTLSVIVSESGPMDGTTYTVAVSGMTSSGTVIVSIPADVVTGGNLASTSTDNVVTYNIAVVSPPTATPTGTDDSGYKTGLPATGFRPGRITLLPFQPAEKAYTTYNDLLLEIPVIHVSMPIVGVPLGSDGWDVSWLGANAGWLNGTAFPTWAGNTVITGHVWDAYNQPGPFAQLKTLRYGDVIKIQAWGQTYKYEVRENRLISPRNTSIASQHEELDWVTLVTCEDYNFLFAKYSYRRIIRAVLIKVSSQ